MTAVVSDLRATAARRDRDDEGAAGLGPPPAALPHTRVETMRSRDGLEHRVYVARPHGKPPSPAGYPLILITDANAAFATVAEAVSLRSRRTEVTGVVPAAVVGLGYPIDEPLDLVRRTFDYTPAPRGPLTMPPRPDGSGWPPVGGADRFLDFIEADVLPAIGRDVPLDPTRRTLFGHSFGGLFTLYALFTRPGLFRTCVAASPSIWFADRVILAHERDFVAALRPDADLRLLITMGGCEQEPTTVECDAVDADTRIAWKQRNRMVDNAREMAARLAPLAGRGLTVDYVEFPDEDHVSVVPAAISRAVTLALGRPLRSNP
ncbi:alpha/beta hydrolase [Rhodoplanes azumiensis]|uniref:Alpha/beta hydrolase n=1 Tax=Rhodoplanes azumiensis TaxID=1897628 RepID=A0ABW5AMZ4_9BRAD